MTDEKIMFARLFAPIKAKIQDKDRDITYLEKENAELKKQNESLKDTLQAIATDTNEHITHNVAQNELNKWELAK